MTYHSSRGSIRGTVPGKTVAGCLISSRRAAVIHGQVQCSRAVTSSYRSEMLGDTGGSIIRSAVPGKTVAGCLIESARNAAADSQVQGGCAVTIH